MASSLYESDWSTVDSELGSSVFEAEDFYPDLYEGLDVPDNLNTGPTLLNNQDYTLNSPLVADHVDNFILYLNDRPYNKLFSVERKWTEKKGWLKTIRRDFARLKTSVHYHRDIAQLLLSPVNNTARLEKLISKTNKDAEKSHFVLKAFFRTWLNKKYEHHNRTGLSSDTLKYGAYMLDAYIITLIINAANEEELDCLIKKFNLKYTDNGKKKKYTGVRYDSDTLGKVYIGYDGVYLDRLNALWDRNMLLMFKDLCTARFHSLLSISSRLEHKYAPEHLDFVEKTYKVGDEIMLVHGDDVYESIGLVEPITSHILSLIAGEERPLIPRFPSFPEHIEKKKNSLEQTYPGVNRFFTTLEKANTKDLLLNLYGSFRHWGHPFINYFEGLKALHKNVTDTDSFPINIEYAEQLASDFTYKVLYGQFHKHKCWYVDLELLPTDHLLYEYVRDGIWPDKDVTKLMPSGWNKLPVTKCWEIPEIADPPIVYSDKSHCAQRSVVLNLIRKGGKQSIKSLKVLESFIFSESTNWPKFLKEIDEVGLLPEDLIIGLKAKERELKKKGRFFALMSWKLREYFVFTEYLIKKEVIPLFQGLTMADDQTTLIKKMMENTIGQGSMDYKSVTVANHLDYNKWNNFQRLESTKPVFEVMGKFFGYPNLFVRTHEFFKGSLIFYCDRPDLMMVDDDKLFNVDPEKLVCWNGQEGGLEGLRQKGWSVLNLLVIEREAGIRNTEVKILAQGDNQVICCLYAIDPYDDDDELEIHLVRLVTNNQAIIDRIREATLSIGLQINEDETLQSSDMLIYGKNIVFRGNITCLEEKRYSRITCMTNDQLPSLSNILSTVSTNCLTVAHYSKSPINSIYNYNWLGNFSINLMDWHNPALRTSPSTLVKNPADLEQMKYRCFILFLDPSLGGISGTSLTRFMIRMFPDPVTEGLTFWRMVFKGSENPEVRSMAIAAGHPKLNTYQIRHLPKLVEDPPSLNIPRGMSAANTLREEIRRTLFDNVSTIVNDVVKDAVVYRKEESDKFINFLGSINHCFPRFFSEFKAATYGGITDGIMSLFENSRTIRNLLKRKMRGDLDPIIIKCEIGGINAMIKASSQTGKTMWQCSATRADELRLKSWGTEVIGTTVPHPAEMLSNVTFAGRSCSDCRLLGNRAAHIVVLVPSGIQNPDDCRGPYPPYFGSSTNESTSLIQTWEKDTDISFLRRASELRKVFHWFVEPSSLLGQSILKNLFSLTGEDPGVIYEGFRRTGSPLHRFGCSRVSAGGYLANSPTYGSRMIISSDQMQRLGTENFDFMYQSSMIYAQQTAGELHNESPSSGVYHFHVSCLECIRPITEPILDCTTNYQFVDKSQILNKWKPAGSAWFRSRLNVEIPQGVWENESASDQSKEIGKIQALMFSELRHSTGRDSKVLTSLFPQGMKNFIQGHPYIQGLKEGLLKAACLSAMTQRYFYLENNVENAIRLSYIPLVQDLCRHPPFAEFCGGVDIAHRMTLTRHRIPPSYPVNVSDMGTVARGILMNFPINNLRHPSYTCDWIFSDLMPPRLSGIILTAHRILQKCVRFMRQTIPKHETRELIEWYRSALRGEIDSNMTIMTRSDNIRSCPREIRHAVRELTPPQLNLGLDREQIFRNTMVGKIFSRRVDYSTVTYPHIEMSVPKILDPTISALRIPQLATGAYLKLEAILLNKNPNIRDFACLGDGSGGCTASLLRRYPESRGIFNSLINMEGVKLGGSLPAPPSAITHMIHEVKSRCVNYLNAWDYSTDLSQRKTWEDLLTIAKTESMNINFIFMDMEVKTEEMTSAIEENLISYLGRLGSTSSTMTLVYKTYVTRLLKNNSILRDLGKMFSTVELIQTDWSSSHTSEIYVYAHGISPNMMAHREIDMIALKTILKKSFVFHSTENEMKRAYSVMEYDICTGIPANLMPDPHVELMGIWSQIAGKDYHLIGFHTLFSIQYHKDAVISALMSLIYLSTRVLHITRWKKTEGEIPSDPDLTKFMSYYAGVWIYVSVLMKDKKMLDRVLFLINKPFYLNIYFHPHRITLKKVDKEGNPILRIGKKYSITWDLGEKHSRFSKKIYLSRCSAMIGASARYLFALRKYTTNDPSSSTEFYRFFSVMDKKLTEELIHAATDIYYPLKH